MEWSSENIVTPYFQFISTNLKIFLKSVTLCLITHPYNPKYSRLLNKNRFHVNANGCLRMHCLRHQLHWPLIYTWILYYHIGHKTWKNIWINSTKTGIITFHQENANYQVNHCWNGSIFVYKLTQKLVNFLRKGFHFLKCRFSFLIML